MDPQVKDMPASLPRMWDSVTYRGSPTVDSAAVKGRVLTLTAVTATGGATPRPTRRSTEDVRATLMATAEELFAAHGYAGTSTRDIAARSGVHESLIYRHFGTKQELFKRAVAEPFAGFVSEYIAVWRETPVMTRSFEALCSEFVAGIFDLLTQHRKLALALANARTYELDESVDASSPFGPLLAQLEEVANAEVTARHFGPIDMPVLIRLIVGTVMSATMFDDWIFADQGRPPSRQRIINELTNLMIHGIAHRPQQLRQEPATPKKKTPSRRTTTPTKKDRPT
jgi:AcrR family transcriptional regulator